VVKFICCNTAPVRHKSAAQAAALIGRVYIVGEVQQLFAIIETGGKQYKVAQGDIISVELLTAEEDSKLEIDKVVALYDGEKLTAGTPYVADAKVSCKVLGHGKGKKVIVFKYKAKKNIRVKNGHRQPFTKLQIEEILV